MNDTDIDYRRIVKVAGNSLNNTRAPLGVLQDADLVIGDGDKVLKDRYGIAGRHATPQEIRRAEDKR